MVKFNNLAYMEQNISEKIHELELSLLSPETRMSSELLGKLLADDFVEFGSSGLVYNKSNVLERLPVTTDKVEFIMSDFSIKVLAEDIILTTFKTKRTINGEVVFSLRSSLWRKQSDDWQIFFHQGTKIEKNK